MTAAGGQGAEADERHRVLLHRGFALELVTVAWDAVGCAVLLLAVLDTRSVALAALGLCSLVRIGAGTVVVRELSGAPVHHRRRALALVGWALLLVAVSLVVAATVALATGHHAVHGRLGIAWSAVTAVVMLALAAGKSRTGRELEDRVLVTAGRATLVDAALASGVVLAVGLDAGLGWWWADAAAGYLVAATAALAARRTRTA